jgi:hypothetical protein
MLGKPVIVLMPLSCFLYFEGPRLFASQKTGALKAAIRIKVYLPAYRNCDVVDRAFRRCSSRSSFSKSCLPHVGSKESSYHHSKAKGLP